MRKSYTPRDYEATHTDPVWRSKANFIIAADISCGAGPKQWEQLWARQIDEHRFEICCIPFFVYDLALGDEVETDSDNVISQIIRPSGSYTFRVWFGEANDPSCRETLPTKLIRLGSELEWASPNLLGVSASNDELANEGAAMLGRCVEDQKIVYETGRTR